VHVDDVATAHVDAAEYLNQGYESQIMNLGTGRGYSVKEIVEHVGKVTDRQVSYLYLPRRAGDPPYLIADITLAEKVLNFRPKYDILTIVETAYNWQKKLDDKQKN
jgi:UDP-glucose 4-epimerase